MQKSISNYIVNGYHASTPISENARKAGLGFRFAMVLDSYHPDFDYMHFQDSFFLACLLQITHKIDHDNIVICADEKSYQSIEAFHRHLKETPEEDRQPPETIRYEKNGKLICFEETEFWVSCGGDAPYSDSYTLSFYSENNMAEKFSDACITASEAEGVAFNDVIQASIVPVKRPFWKKMFG